MNQNIIDIANEVGFSMDSPEALKFAQLLLSRVRNLVLNGMYDEEKFDPQNAFHCGHNTALDNAVIGVSAYFGN